MKTCRPSLSNKQKKNMNRIEDGLKRNPRADDDDYDYMNKKEVHKLLKYDLLDRTDVKIFNKNRQQLQKSS